MSLVVNSNLSSLNAQRQLFNSSNGLTTSFERLSSGFRINRAADDAAGMQISDRLTSQIGGLNQGIKNANDGISLVQTADGALAETTNNIQRLRQLAIQAQNGVNSLSDKMVLQQEVNDLKSEINRIAQDTTFAGRSLLDGQFSSSFLVGANGSQNIDVNISSDYCGGFDCDALGLAELDVVNDTAIDTSSVVGADDLGSGQGFFDVGFAVQGDYRFAVSIDGGKTYNEIEVSLYGNLLTDTQLMEDAINEGICERTFPSASTAGPITYSITNEPFRIAEYENNPSILDAGSNPVGLYGDTDTISALDEALLRVNSVRAELGATQNRFQSTIRNLSNIVENVSNARSGIQDTDFATETAALTKNQIIQQASLSVLSQANQRPQTALSLLG